ncbi:MAG TPA: acylphosphatase [Arachnia sp.]|nr:acylphosphatase [Arachnia sp.]HMR13778.1 acylphosphatase [Arachnia sp.]
MKRVHVVVTGRVQGVGYRYSLWSVAERAGVTGWVRNRGYDSVEAELEGAPEAVDEVLDWMLSGPPMARVDHRSVTPVAVTGSSRFEILYSV